MQHKILLGRGSGERSLKLPFGCGDPEEIKSWNAGCKESNSFMTDTIRSWSEANARPAKAGVRSMTPWSVKAPRAWVIGESVDSNRHSFIGISAWVGGQRTRVTEVQCTSSDFQGVRLRS